MREKLKVEIISAMPGGFKPGRPSLGSGDSDHDVYNDESPLPIEERRYKLFLK